MIRRNPLACLLAMQTASGAFPSTVDGGAVRLADETCFVTSSVVLLLLDISNSIGKLPDLDRAIARGLAFIERCADPDLPGAFRFYPRRAQGFQVRHDLPPDADDTALAWMALVGAGSRSAQQAADAVEPLFDRIRIRARSRGDAPWVRTGVYRTWLDGSLAVNPADLCVNANILACRAIAGLPRLPEVVETLRSTRRAWTATPGNLRVLAPYYAHPDEVEIAIARAVRTGAMPQDGLSATPEPAPDDQPLYCNSHGRPIWRSPALHRARHLQRALIQPKEIVHAPDAAICS